MKGLNHTTGRPVDGLDHLRQSIEVILTTPIGSRVMRRNFGSNLHRLVDAPNNGATRARLVAATATALMKWEPRLKVTRISISSNPAAPHQQFIDIEGNATASGQLMTARVALAARR